MAREHNETYFPQEIADAAKAIVSVRDSLLHKRYADMDETAAMSWLLDNWAHVKACWEIGGCSFLQSFMLSDAPEMFKGYLLSRIYNSDSMAMSWSLPDPTPSRWSECPQPECCKSETEWKQMCDKSSIVDEMLMLRKQSATAEELLAELERRGYQVDLDVIDCIVFRGNWKIMDWLLENRKEQMMVVCSPVSFAIKAIGSTREQMGELRERMGELEGEAVEMSLCEALQIVHKHFPGMIAEACKKIEYRGMRW